ncbi:GGDEF domain-containing protein [Actinoplanes sp. NPDC049681]|uniref:GGDEF domain-containing protein n=1 Tax=Actinoplanes sp. NPDC049681 TaxID=3363905 RepID=UPI0037B3C2BD
MLRRPLIIIVLVTVSAAECAVVFTLKPAAAAIVDAAALITAVVMATVVILWFRGRVDRLVTELRRQALADPLTGLPNRRAFERHLQDEVADPARHPLSLLAVDLDRFKAINDAFGHAAGDEVLRIVAGALRTVARGDDFAARLDRDEFALIVRGGSAAAGRVAERMRRTLAVATGSPGGAPTLSITPPTCPG